MSNPWDANIKLLYAVDDGMFFTLDVLPSGQPFDVIANVEIGENLNENVDRFELRVAIVNLTQSKTLLIGELKDNLTPQNNTQYHAELRVDFNDPWSADTGDVLHAVASYKVIAGVNYDISTAQSDTFVVV